MTLRDKLKLVWKFFVFNVRSAPMLMKFGLVQTWSGIKFLFAGLTLPIRGLFHSGELFKAVAEEEERRRNFFNSLADLAHDLEPAPPEAAAQLEKERGN
jgi:hypothetical protein